MDNPRDVILKASEHFTKAQKARLIIPWDLLDAGMRFSWPIHFQLQQDYWVQRHFWDACSMIAQSEELNPSEDGVRAFTQWAFGILGYQGQVDE
jgi:hypothetical protein